MPSLVVAGLAAVVSWWITGSLGGLAMPLAIIPAWGLLRTTCPAEGMIVKRLVTLVNRDLVGAISFCMVWILVAYAGLRAYTSARHRLSYPGTTLAVGAILWCGIFGYEFWRLGRRGRLREQEATDLAAKLRGEPVDDREWAR